MVWEKPEETSISGDPHGGFAERSAHSDPCFWCRGLHSSPVRSQFSLFQFYRSGAKLALSRSEGRLQSSPSFPCRFILLLLFSLPIKENIKDLLLWFLFVLQLWIRGRNNFNSWEITVFVHSDNLERRNANFSYIYWYYKLYFKPLKDVLKISSVREGANSEFPTLLTLKALWCLRVGNTIWKLAKTRLNTRQKIPLASGNSQHWLFINMKLLLAG